MIHGPRSSIVPSHPLAHRRASSRPALCRVSFSVGPGQSLGVVGRTGSGKSSLLAALFRLQPVCGGAVMLDGVNVAAVGVRRLRWVMPP